MVACCLCFLSSHLNVVERRDLGGRLAPVNSKSDAVDETAIITGEEDDCRSKFLRLSFLLASCTEHFDHQFAVDSI